ncbi:MAG: hypothetical protein WCF78_01805 [archaeon]
MNSIKNRDEINKSVMHKSIILSPDGSEMEFNKDNKEDLAKINNPELKAYILSEEIKGQPREAPTFN